MRNMSAKERSREAFDGVKSQNRPRPWKPKPIPTVFMDYVTGQGVLDNGASFKASILGRTKNPTLTDKLKSVDYASQGVDHVRIIFTGKVPPNDRNTRHWLLVETPGWVGQHHLGTPPAGRFDSLLTSKRIEVRVASEWFGDVALTPRQALTAWTILNEGVNKVWYKIEGPVNGSPLLMSPAATGTNLWAASMPGSLDPVPVPADIAEEIHATSGQHHQDHFVTGPGMDSHRDVLPMIDTRLVSTLPNFSYVDGRFMYAALCLRLGTGPGVRLARREAADLWREDKYFRGRMRVKFTVPDTWNHVGILGVQHENPAHGWFYPNRPGAVHTTWADAAEIFVAEKHHGWLIEPIEAIVFQSKMPSVRKRYEEGATTATRRPTEARPLDEWALKLQAMRAKVASDPEYDDVTKRALGAAIRAILIQGIGSFASRGRSATRITTDPALVPTDVHVERKGKVFAWQQPQAQDERSKMFYHPEFTSQIWGRGRARIMDYRPEGVPTGALHVDPSTIIGINGDAVYTTTPPHWSLPVEQGGADDGKVGKLRLQGYLEGPITPPGSRAERDKLRARAVKNGPNIGAALDDSMVDQSAFRLEFDSTDDRVSSYDSADPDTESN